MGDAESEGSSSAPPASEAAIGKATDWPAAVKRIRDTNEWIVKAFVGLGALLLGTTPLLAFARDLSLDDRGIAAGIGILLSLAGAGAIAWLASDVNLTETTDINELLLPDEVPDPLKRTTLRSLARRVTSSDDARVLYLFGEDSVAALIARRRRNVEKLRNQAEVLNQVPPKQLDQQGELIDNPDHIELQSFVDQSRQNIAAIDEQLTWLADWASYETVRDRFRRNRALMALAGFVAFLGMCTWVIALNADLTDDGEGSPAAASPVSAGQVGVLTWSIPAEGAEPTPNQEAAADLREALASEDASMASDRCDTVGVLVESGNGTPESPWQVSVLPRDPCPARVRFTVDQRLAVLAPFAASDNPKTAVTIEADDFDEGRWLVVLLYALAATAIVSGAIGAHRRRRRPGGRPSAD